MGIHSRSWPEIVSETALMLFYEQAASILHACLAVRGVIGKVVDLLTQRDVTQLVGVRGIPQIQSPHVDNECNTEVVTLSDSSSTEDDIDAPDADAFGDDDDELDDEVFF